MCDFYFLLFMQKTSVAHKSHQHPRSETHTHTHSRTRAVSNSPHNNKRLTPALTCRRSHCLLSSYPLAVATQHYYRHNGTETNSQSSWISSLLKADFGFPSQCVGVSGAAGRAERGSAVVSQIILGLYCQAAGWRTYPYMSEDSDV